ncbi:histone-lysine N-methyltransferase 2D-like isoform X3 [Palaemon carinicauda]
MSLKVSRTCNDIIRHIDQKGQGERPKFSLYLSTMLFYGTVKVYHRQVRFLLEELVNIHKILQRQSALILDLDLAIPGTQRMTPHSPSPLEGLHYTDLDDYLAMEPPPRVSLETPRKHAVLTSLKMKGHSSAEPLLASVEETLREEQEEDMENITLLLRDWEETPTRARAEDITLREETLQCTRPFWDVALADQTFGPLDFGPPFCMLEGPLATLPVQPELDTVRKRLDLDSREEQDQHQHQQQPLIDGDHRVEQKRTLPSEHIAKRSTPSKKVRGLQQIEQQQTAGECLLEEPILQDIYEMHHDRQPPLGQVGEHPIAVEPSVVPLVAEPAPEQEPFLVEPIGVPLSIEPVSEQYPSLVVPIEITLEQQPSLVEPVSVHPEQQPSLVEPIAVPPVEPIPEQQPSFVEPPPIHSPNETKEDNISITVEATPCKEPAKDSPERPKKAPPTAPDVTPVVCLQPEIPFADASQIILSPVEQVLHQTKPRVPRKHRLIIDSKTQLMRTKIRERCQNTKIALRCEEPDKDTIDITSLKFMDAKKLLSSPTHLKIMAQPLMKLITRHYRVLMSPTDQNQRGYFEFSPEARRQLRMSGTRAAPVEVSDFADTSAVSALEFSKESGQSFLQISTGQLEAGTLPGLISELIPIQEEQATIPQPDVTETFLINGDIIESPPVVDLDEGSGREPVEGICKGPKEQATIPQPDVTETFLIYGPPIKPPPVVHFAVPTDEGSGRKPGEGICNGPKEQATIPQPDVTETFLIYGPPIKPPPVVHFAVPTDEGSGRKPGEGICNGPKEQAAVPQPDVTETFLINGDTIESPPVVDLDEGSGREPVEGICKGPKEQATIPQPDVTETFLINGVHIEPLPVVHFAVPSDEGSVRKPEEGICKGPKKQATIPQPNVTETFLINAAPIESPPVVDFAVPSDVGSGPEPGEGICKGHKRLRELDESITLASPKRTLVPRETTFGLFESPQATNRRGPPPSPKGGLQHGTIEAEIYPPSSKDVPSKLLPTAGRPVGLGIPRMEQTPKETAGFQGTKEFVVSDIPFAQSVSCDNDRSSQLPSRSRKITYSADRILTPKSYHLSHAELAQHVLKKGKRNKPAVFEDFLPLNPTKTDAANLFASLLEMHKSRAIELSQKENYGTIYVKKF